MKPSLPLTAALTAILLTAAAAAPANSSPPATTTTSGTSSTGAGGAPKGPANLANPVRKTTATIDLVCDDKTYTLSTGTTTGSCGTSGKDSVAICTDGNTVTAHASCRTGCLATRDNGSCTAKD